MPALPLAVLIAAVILLLAQSERNPIALREATRMQDDVQARKEYDRNARALLSPQFRAALAGYKPGGAVDMAATWGEFLAADGLPFVAVHFAPRPGVLSEGDQVAFFGQVVDAAGKTVATYNQVVPAETSKGDVFVERSLTIPLQKSTGTFGLAKRGEIVAMNRIDFDPEALSDAAPGVSRLIVSRDVHVLGSSQGPLDPFSFGGTRVVPNPSSTFRKSDEVWLFVEVRRPSLGSDGVPHINTKVAIDGPSKKTSGVTTPAEATPLKGVPGHYGIGSTIDVSSFASGEYKLRVTVTDTIAKTSTVRETAIKLE
jgi:hypothetical protein